jgi:hypothetical protein
MAVAADVTASSATLRDANSAEVARRDLAGQIPPAVPAVPLARKALPCNAGPRPTGPSLPPPCQLIREKRRSYVQRS